MSGERLPRHLILNDLENRCYFISWAVTLSLVVLLGWRIHLETALQYLSHLKCLFFFLGKTFWVISVVVIYRKRVYGKWSEILLLMIETLRAYQDCGSGSSTWWKWLARRALSPSSRRLCPWMSQYYPFVSYYWYYPSMSLTSAARVYVDICSEHAPSKSQVFIEAVGIGELQWSWSSSIPTASMNAWWRVCQCHSQVDQYQATSNLPWMQTIGIILQPCTGGRERIRRKSAGEAGWGSGGIPVTVKVRWNQCKSASEWVELDSLVKQCWFWL